MVTYMEILKEMVYTGLEYDQCIRRIKGRRFIERKKGVTGYRNLLK